MDIQIVIELIALVLAVGGLILQPKKDPSAPPSWRNLTKAGRAILVLIIVLSGAKTVKGMNDAAKSEAHLKQLREDNERLIKVMSVSTGYNAVVNGTVTFNSPPPDVMVRDALQNVFLKFAHVKVEAQNSLGNFRGRIDYGAHPEVRKFLNLARPVNDPVFEAHKKRIPSDRWGQTYFFEIRTANLRLLNDANIQYARFGNDKPLLVDVEVFPGWGDFRSLYKISEMYIDRLKIEELDDVAIYKELN